MNPIKRETYLCELINRKENGLIKVITGIRRVGLFLWTLWGKRNLRLKIAYFCSL